jgi:hypothetical protein
MWWSLQEGGEGTTPFEFKLITAAKTFILRAPSEHELVEWIKAIAKHKLVTEQIVDGNTPA